MTLPVEQYVQQVDAARRTAWRVLILAALSWWTGWVVIVGCLVAWLVFNVSLVETLEIILAIGVGSVLGGVGLYATSHSLGIAATRLEISLASKPGG